MIIEVIKNTIADAMPLLVVLTSVYLFTKLVLYIASMPQQKRRYKVAVGNYNTLSALE